MKQKLKQDDVQKGRSTGESYKSDGKPISTSHKVRRPLRAGRPFYYQLGIAVFAL